MLDIRCRCQAGLLVLELPEIRLFADDTDADVDVDVGGLFDINGVCSCSKVGGEFASCSSSEVEGARKCREFFRDKMVERGLSG